MSKRDTLIQLRQSIHQELKDFISDLDEEERSAPGTAEEWSIKNELTHVGLWDERMGLNLQDIGKGEEPTDYADFNDINAQDYEVHKDDSWEEVEALLDRSEAALTTGLALLDDQQLNRNDLLPGNQERSTWGRISGTCIMHPMLHMSGYITKKGQHERALELVVGISDQMKALDAGDEWQGLVTYNKSCYYALAGHKEQAIELLSAALPLNSALVEWSKEDADLDSLREEPEYKALYSD